MSPLKRAAWIFGGVSVLLWPVALLTHWYWLCLPLLAFGLGRFLILLPKALRHPWSRSR